MRHRRCGHAVALTREGDIAVAGGYGGSSEDGEEIYWRSCEVLETSAQAEEWKSLPDMHDRRTGHGFSAGPDGCLYAVGGSPDGGVTNHATAERLDMRTGKWERLREMTESRGYCAATFGMSGLLFVVGGCEGEGVTGMFPWLRTAECFDPRTGTWRALEKLDGIGCSDLALAYCPRY